MPGDAVWQTRVLRAVLELLDASSGPVLADFPDDAPVAPDEPTALACPVNFPAPITDLNDMERLGKTLQDEVRELRSWYDLAVTKSGRTTVGASGLGPEAIGTFVGAFLGKDMPPSPQDDVPALAMLKLAVEDLKAYYFEAVAAQPGQRTATGTTLTNWFWRETAAGKVLFTLQELWKTSEDRNTRLLSRNLMVPRTYAAESPYVEAST